MHEGKAVYKDGNVVPCFMFSTGLLILVDDLKAVVVDVLLVQQVYVLGRAVIPL